MSNQFHSMFFTSRARGSRGRSAVWAQTRWSYNDDEYPRLKNFENTVASTVSVKPLGLLTVMPQGAHLTGGTLQLHHEIPFRRATQYCRPFCVVQLKVNKN